MATLYVMVGAPGSGKSTWAKRFITNRDNIVYLSRDHVRLSIIKETEHYFSHEDEVYDVFTNRIVELLSEGKDVVADATHLSHGARFKLISTLAVKGMPMSQYDLVFVCMDTPLAVCVARDALREGRQHVTEPVLTKMYNSFRVPTTGEFTNVKEVWLIRG